MSRYEYSLIRYQHDPSAGEFANIGVILFDLDERRLLTQISPRYGRVREFFRDLNGTAYRSIVHHVERRFLELNEELRQPDMLHESPSALDEILSKLIAPEEDSCIRASTVMYGVDNDPETRLQELFAEYVLRYEEVSQRERRDEEDVRRALDDRLIRSHLVNRVQFDYRVETPTYGYTFHAAWQNGRRQVLEPISFDLVEATRIVEKATQWSGRLYTLAKGGGNFGFNSIVAPPADPTLERAFSRALSILRGSPNAREIVLEPEAERALQLIAAETTDTNTTSG